MTGERSDQVSLDENAGVRNANFEIQKLLVGRASLLGGVGLFPWACLSPNTPSSHLELHNKSAGVALN